MSKEHRYDKLSREEFMEDNRWKFKGGPIQRKATKEPKVCPECSGLDPLCLVCFGEGIVYD
jgi:hypothetical protein